MVKATTSQRITHYLVIFFWTALGAFLAAFSIETLLIPHSLIDGGVVGLSMIGAHLLGKQYLPYFLLLLTLPFLFLAYRSIGKTFVIQMFVAVILFAISLHLVAKLDITFDKLGILEVMVASGALLGLGGGLIIRHGGCIDGTEILAIIISRTRGFTVGQVILVINVLVFTIAGIVYQDPEPALRSMIMFIVASKMMDIVIVGFDETKSVTIISGHPKQVAEALVHELGIGLTVFYGRGGFTGKDKEILYAIVERLQLAELKEIIHREDPHAFIAVQNLHEVINGHVRMNLGGTPQAKKIKEIFQKTRAD